jgi:hypothetical protein
VPMKPRLYTLHGAAVELQTTERALAARLRTVWRARIFRRAPRRAKFVGLPLERHALGPLARRTMSFQASR